MSLFKKILSNTAIQIFGKVLTAALSIVIIKYITGLENVPGLEGLPAEYKLIYTYLSFFGILADFGLFTIAVREMSKTNSLEQQREIMGNIFGMRFFTIMIAMALASLFVFLIPHENYPWTVKVGVALAAITTVLTMLASTVSSILQVHLKMTQPTLALITGKIIMAGYIIYVVIYFSEISYAFYHLILAGIVGSLVTFIMTFRYTKGLFPFQFHYHFPYWKKIFIEAFPYGLAIVLSTMYFKIDVLLISFFRDQQEIAIYGYPSSIIELLAIFPVYFMNSVLPSLSKAFQENKKRAEVLASVSLNFLALITFPMVIGGLLLSRELMAFVMHEKFLTGNVPGYYGADVAFQLLLLPAVFAFLNTLFNFLIIASGHQGKLLKINGIGVAFNIIANLIFIPSYGFLAAGIVTIFSEILIIVLTIRESRRYIRFPIDVSALLKISFASVAMGALVVLLKQGLPVLALVPFGASIFLILCVLFGIFNHVSQQRSGV